MKRRLDEEPDFIFLKRFDYSIAKVLARYPDGAPAKLIAQGLMMTEDDVDATFNEIVLSLRRSMKVDL